MAQFDPAAATATYIDGLGPAALAKAAAYTTGNHWLLLWGTLVTIAVCWLAIRIGLLDRLSRKLERRGFALRTWIMCAAFMLFLSVVSLPWDIYASWWRETAYGRTSQPIGDYLGQGAIAIAIGALFGGLFFLGVYALLRRTGKRWWIWSGALTALAISTAMIIAPLARTAVQHIHPGPAGTGAHRA